MMNIELRYGDNPECIPKDPETKKMLETDFKLAVLQERSKRVDWYGDEIKSDLNMPVERTFNKNDEIVFTIDDMNNKWLGSVSLIGWRLTKPTMEIKIEYSEVLSKENYVLSKEDETALYVQLSDEVNNDDPEYWKDSKIIHCTIKDKIKRSNSKGSQAAILMKSDTGIEGGIYAVLGWERIE